MQQSGGRLAKGGATETRVAAQRHCRQCGKAGHNVRTCQEVEETLDEDSDVESN